MKKSKNIAIVCAVTGVCVLTSAAFASYQTANGYDALKKSLINTIDYKNCTVSANLKMSVDDKELTNYSASSMIDADNKMQYSSTKESGIGSSEMYGYSAYTTKDYRYTKYGSDDYYVRSDYYGNAPSNLWDIDDESRPTLNKVVRFMELASDTVVGDLKNNFVCTEDTDDHTSYSLTLDSVQIPEIVNAGLSMVFSMSNNSSSYYIDYDDNGNPIQHEYTEDDLQYYTAKLGNDPVVDSINMNYSLNKDGSFSDGNMVVVFTGNDESGNRHTMTFDVNLSITDIGTTVITPIEGSGANIKTYDDEGNLVNVTE